MTSFSLGNEWGRLPWGGDLSCRPDEPANVKGSPAACGAGELVQVR
ncbi:MULTISPECIES: hypothetical protein [Clostridia]|nr:MULTISPECIES: hypothetical protein [Clostridia]